MIIPIEGKKIDYRSKEEVVDAYSRIVKIMEWLFSQKIGPFQE
jgi:hypothetical protein